jgi:WD40 repeat protein
MKTADKSHFDWSLLLGFDIFISYKRGPAASTYSRNLRNGLAEMGFKCFLDQEQTEGGVELTPALQRALRRSRLLLVLAEPNALLSSYVSAEVREFLSRRNGCIVPINVGAFLEAGKAQPAPFDYLQTLTWLSESEERFALGSPTDAVLGGLRKSFRRLRVASISRAITWTAIVVLATAAIVAFVQRQAALRETEMALAQAYASDLNLAELADASRDTRSVLELLSPYERRTPAERFPEFGWRLLWGRYNNDRHRLQQEAAVLGLALSPDGTSLATIVGYSEETKGGVVRLWDMSSGRERFRTALPRLTYIRAVAFAPEGNVFATTVHDGGQEQEQIVVWDGATGTRLKTIVVHGAIGALAFTRDARSIVALFASGQDAPFQMWDVQTSTPRYAANGTDLDERITAWAYAPDGKTVAVAYDKPPHVSLWDVATRTVRVALKSEEDSGFQQVVGGVAYSPDGSLLATAHGTAISSSGYHTGGPGRVRLWDAISGQMVAVLEGHTMGAHTVTFAPNGKLFASASGEPEAWKTGAGSQVTIWDASTKKPLVTLEQAATGFVQDIAFSGDSRLMAIASDDGIVTLVDAATGQIRTQLRGHTGGITAIRFSNDGRTLATSSADGTARLWDTHVDPETLPFGEGAEAVNGVAFSPDGNTVALALADGTVVLKDAASLSVTRRVFKPPVPLEELAFSADGKRLAGYGDSSITVWDLDTGRMQPPLSTNRGRVDAIRLGPSGQHVTAALVRDGSTTTLERWDVEAARLIAKNDIEISTQLLAMSDDGASIAVRQFERKGNLQIRDVSSSRSPSIVASSDRSEEITAAAFSRDGSLLAVAEGGRFSPRHRIAVLDARTLKSVAELFVDDLHIHALAFDADGRRLAGAGFSERMMTIAPRSSMNYMMARVRIWDLESATERVSFSVDSATINEMTLRRQSTLHFMSGGRTLAVKERNALLVTDAETGRFVAASRRAAATVRSVAVTADDRALVVTMQPGNDGSTDTVKVWDAQKNALASVLPKLPPAEAWSTAFSADGHRLAVGSEAGSVRVYDARTNEVTAVLETHGGPVQSLAFSPDGRTLTTGSADTTVRSWDFRSDKSTQLTGIGHVLAIAIAPGAEAIATVERDGTLIAMQLPGGSRRFAVPIGASAHTPLVFSPDGKLLAVASNAIEGRISIRDARTGEEQARLQGDRAIRALALWRNGLVAAGAANGRVTVWQLPSTQPIATIPASRGGPDEAPVAPAVLDLQFDPVKARLAIAHADGKVEVRRHDDKSWGVELTGHSREVRSLAFAPDGETLASADARGRVVLWNIAASADDRMRAVLREDRRLAVARLTPDGKTIATGGNDKAVVLWDVTAGTRQAVLVGHTAPVTAVVFSRNGRALASASRADVIMWDVPARKRLNTFEGSAPIDLASSGNRLATTLDERTVAIWATGFGGRQATIEGLAARPTAIIFSADEKTLAIVADNRVTLWNAVNGRQRAALNGYQGGTFPAIAISPDSRTVATAGQDGRIDLWLALTGRRLLTLRDLKEAPLDVRFSPNGARLIAATETGLRTWRAAPPR